MITVTVFPRKEAIGHIKNIFKFRHNMSTLTKVVRQENDQFL